MVEYEGMIINALLAERRRFLGMTLQRVARLNDALGGGSLTLLGVMYHEAGRTAASARATKARGQWARHPRTETARPRRAIPELPAGFESMPEATKAKIEATIEKRKLAAESARAARAERATPRSRPRRKTTSRSPGLWWRSS